MKYRSLLALIGLFLSLALVGGPAAQATPADGGKGSPAAAKRKAGPPIAFSAPAKANASRVVTLKAVPKRVGVRATTYLQVKTGSTWNNVFAACIYDDPGPSAQWKVTMPASGTVTYRAVSKWKGKWHASNTKTIRVIAQTNSNPEPSAPITETERRHYVEVMADAINDDREAHGLSRLPINWNATNGEVQTKTVNYYRDGIRPPFSGIKALAWGTHTSQKPPTVTPSTFRESNLTSLGLGYYFDQHEAFDGKMSAFVIVAY